MADHFCHVRSHPPFRHCSRRHILRIRCAVRCISLAGHRYVIRNARCGFWGNVARNADLAQDGSGLAILLPLSEWSQVFVLGLDLGYRESDGGEDGMGCGCWIAPRSSPVWCRSLSDKFQRQNTSSLDMPPSTALKLWRGSLPRNGLDHPEFL